MVRVPASRRVAMTRDQSASAVMISGPVPQSRSPPEMKASPMRWLVRPSRAAISCKRPRPCPSGRLAPDAQDAGEMRDGRHRRFSVRPSPSRSGRADGGEPAVGAPDMGRGGGQLQVCAIGRHRVDGQARAAVAVAVDHDDFGPAIAVEIGETGGDILEHLGPRQGDAGNATVGAELDGERVGLDPVAEDGMGVARGGIFVPGGGGALRGVGSGERAFHRRIAPGRGFAGRSREGICKPQGRREERAAGGTGPTAQRVTRRHRGASQICFSGICTTRPSSASETLSWQVRRERSGSGW